jgi:hypothetical protein
MDLEQFVADSLAQIVQGVHKAQKAIEGTGAKINPADAARSPDEFVEFDVAVTAAEEKATGGKINVLTAVVGLNARGESNASNTTASRIKFKVLVKLPPGPPSPTEVRVYQ